MLRRGTEVAIIATMSIPTSRTALLRLVGSFCAASLLLSCAPDVEIGEQEFWEDPAIQAGQDAQPVSSEGQLGSPRMRITLLDVGQGDGLLVELPGGRRLVIDGGPRQAYAAQLQGLGVDRVDTMVLTHAHDDHYSGLVPVLDMMPKDCVGRVLDPGYESPLVGYRGFRGAAGCRHRRVSTGQGLSLDPRVRVRVVSATDDAASTDSHEVNDTSVMLQLRFNRFTFLSTGDAEVGAERGAVARGGLRSTVLKLGHHGSCTATGRSFLQAVAPRHALISAGSGNSYGLPHCQTVAKLKERKGAGLRWLRTDLNGAVTVVTDGERYVIRGERGTQSGESCPRSCADPQDF